MRSISVSRHAVHRYADHNRTADESSVLSAILAGDVVDLPLALALAGRRPESADDGDVFVVSSCRRGMFVINKQGRVVTYLRLSSLAAEVMKDERPSGHAVDEAEAILREVAPPSPAESPKKRKTHANLYAEKMREVSALVTRLRRSAAALRDIHDVAWERSEAINIMVKRIINSESLGELRAWVIDEFEWVHDWAKGRDLRRELGLPAPPLVAVAMCAPDKQDA